MKFKTQIVLFLVTFGFFSGASQTKITKETKVIAVVTDDTITALELFENKNDQKEKLIKKYPRGKFYIGLLKGRYELKEQVIIPKNEATITLFTEKQVFKGGTLFKDKKLKQGEAINIGKTKAKVVAAKKGELIIKTNN